MAGNGNGVATAARAAVDNAMSDKASRQPNHGTRNAETGKYWCKHCKNWRGPAGFKAHAVKCEKSGGTHEVKPKTNKPPTAGAKDDNIVKRISRQDRVTQAISLIFPKGIPTQPIDTLHRVMFLLSEIHEMAQ